MPEFAVLLDRHQIHLHLLPATVAFAIVLAATTWYVRDSVAADRWLGGGSTVGLVCGVTSALIIAFEMLLWPRKALRRMRLFPTKYWLAAHLWIGLASLPLAILHCGFHLGGYLPAILMLLFLATIASGVYGWTVQNILPKWMLHNLPAETIYNQIDHVSGLSVEDVRHMLVVSCGRRPTVEDQLRLDLQGFEDMDMNQTIIIGAVRDAARGKTTGRTLQTGQVARAQDDRERLWTAFDNLEGFLRHGAIATSPVNDRRESTIWFNRLRKECGEESRNLIDVLEQQVEQRRQFDTQRVVHRWLHGWLPLHVGLSMSVCVLLIVHVWTALRYW